MKLPKRGTLKKGLQHREAVAEMKIIITQSEAVEKGIWPEVRKRFGLSEEDEVWEREEFILTEEEARNYGLIH
ncbi:hypothetical protein HMSSN036_56810 [Paenibacillus macerans]|nr:hypothetical protein BK140_28860 [Paenibacillus macerans]GJM73465.1 hypothetical protein HMSSN036_56810 [Paenibacillus macerans]